MRLRRRPGRVFITLLVGLFFGAILGHIMSSILPILDEGLKVGFRPLSLNLYLFDVDLSLNFNITLAAIIGMLVAFLIADFGRR